MTCDLYSSNSQALSNYDKLKTIEMNGTECDRLIEPLREYVQYFEKCPDESITEEVLYGSQLGDNLITKSSALFNDLKNIGENASTCAYDKKRIEERGVKLDCAMQVNNINQIRVGTLLVRMYGTYDPN